MPPSAHIYQTTRQPQYKIRLLFSSRLQASKKRRLCKTVQNQALFFHPASSPLIIRIIIVNTIIFVNILFEHTAQTDGQRTVFFKDALSSDLKKPDISYYSPATQKHKRHLSAKLLNKVSNVLVYIFVSFRGLESIQ